MKPQINRVFLLNPVACQNTVCTFQLKSFEHNNVILLQIFPIKIENLISAEVLIRDLGRKL